MLEKGFEYDDIWLNDFDFTNAYCNYVFQSACRAEAVIFYEQISKYAIFLCYSVNKLYYYFKLYGHVYKINIFNNKYLYLSLHIALFCIYIYNI